MIPAAVLHFWYGFFGLTNAYGLFGLANAFHNVHWVLKKINVYAYSMLIIKVETGRVDGHRLCITGESAGGFTTLACLAFRQTFMAGCSLYGASFNCHFSVF